jgi:hypothetical protein
MANHIVMMGQPDILSLPVDMLCRECILFLGLIVDDEGTFDIDLDGSCESRYSVQSVIVRRREHVLCQVCIGGGHAAHARRQLMNRGHAVDRPGLGVVGVIVYADMLVEVT